MEHVPRAHNSSETRQQAHTAARGELGRGEAGGDGDSRSSEESGGDATVLRKAVVGCQVIR